MDIHRTSSLLGVPSSLYHFLSVLCVLLNRVYVDVLGRTDTNWHVVNRKEALINTSEVFILRNRPMIY